MTNNEIIAASVLETVGNEAVAALAATIYTPAQLAARRASIRVELAPDSAKKEDNLNATVRWTVACHRLDGGNSLIKSIPPAIAE